MTDLALPLHGVGERRPDCATVCGMFDHAVATAPEVVALRHKGVRFTYREEGRAVAALARRLAAVAAPGEVVALLLPNSIAFRVAYFAALQALTAPALLNPLYPAPQLEPLLREVSPRAVICTPAARETVLGLADPLGIPAVICLEGDLSVERLAAEHEGPLERPAPRPEDIGALLFSGGTTGVPKAVEHTHARLVIAVRCVEYNWPTRMSGEVWLPIAPFTHVYGFLQGVLTPVSARAEVVIPERF
ncbi:MAG: acyl--CoA ligase, partial [Acetobacteraceae bacterium]|nr:acyl--CoA ligase [Acetobacteraceae bacterium]